MGVGVPIARVKDKAHSPLAYSGFALNLHLGFERISPTEISRFAINSILYCQMTPKVSPRPKRSLSVADLNSGQFTYSYYRQQGGGKYVGGQAILQLDMTNYSLPSNNVLGYQLNFSVGVGGQYRNKIDEKNNRYLNYEAQLPLLTYTLRPAYVGMPKQLKELDLNQKNGNWQYLKQGKITTVHQFFQFKNRIDIEQQNNEYRANRLHYTWQYLYNGSQPKSLRQVIGGVGYDTFFKM